MMSGHAYVRLEKHPGPVNSGECEEGIICTECCTKLYSGSVVTPAQ
jgi:hypothetical protein